MAVGALLGLSGCKGSSGEPQPGNLDMGVDAGMPVKLGYLYVANSGSNDISVLSYDSAGELSMVQQIGADTGPQSLVLDATNSRLFVGNKSGIIIAYGIDASTGTLSVESTVTATGAPPVGAGLNTIALHPSASILYATTYQEVVPFGVCADGSFVQGGPLVFPTNASPFSLAIEPSGTVGYVSASTGSTPGPTCGGPGCTWIDIYRVDLDPMTGTLQLGLRQLQQTNAAQLILDGAKKAAYGTNGLMLAPAFGGPTRVFAFDPVRHLLTGGTNVPGTNLDDDIVLTSDGAFALVAATDGVYSYGVSPVAGALSGPIDPMAGDASAIAVDPTGQFVFATLMSSSSVQVYSADGSGKLVRLSSSALVGTQPKAIALLPLSSQPAPAAGNSGCPFAPADLGTCSPLPPVTYSSGGSSIAVADFNRDGKLDMLTSGAQLFLGNGDGTFQNPTSTAIAGPAVTAADVNGDGKPDLVTTEAVALGNGDGTFQTPVTYANTSSGVAVVAADFNRDGKLDLAVPQASTLAIQLGNGDGTFQTPTNLSVVANWIVSADFNADGKTDLAASTISGVDVLLSNGDGTFQAPLFHGIGTGAPGGLAVGDFDGDAKLDIAVALSNGVDILLGKGDGTFQQASSIASLGSAIATVDFNHDGKLDLAVSPGSPMSGPVTHLVAVLFGYGTGEFQNPIVLGGSGASGHGGLVAADFNGDGKPDIAVGNSTPSVSILLNNDCVP